MLMAHGLMVMAVDGSRMQLLRNRGTEAKPELELVASEYSHNPATHVLGSEKPGRSFTSTGTSRHAYTEQDLHEVREDEFAVAALGWLSDQLKSDAKVILIAPPRMLGQLRKMLPESIQPRILATFSKDLTQHSPGEICRFLKDQK